MLLTFYVLPPDDVVVVASLTGGAAWIGVPCIPILLPLRMGRLQLIALPFVAFAVPSLCEYDD